MTTLNTDQNLALIVAPGAPAVAADQELALLVEQRLVPQTIFTRVDQTCALLVVRSGGFTFVFQSPSGTPLAGGTATFRINVDAATTSYPYVQVCAGRLVSVVLDASGACTVNLIPNDQLTGDGRGVSTVYLVKAYTSTGLLALSGQAQISTGESSPIFVS
jgi:hypothetical protein